MKSNDEFRYDDWTYTPGKLSPDYGPMLANGNELPEKNEDKKDNK